MEVPAQKAIDRYYEVPEIEKIPRGIEASGDVSKGVAENARYVVRRKQPSNSSTDRGLGEKTLDNDDGMEVILLLQEEEPARRRREAAAASERRIIELSDNDCKLVLRRQLEMTNAAERNDASVSSRDAESAEMLRKLPADTTVTRQEATRSSRGQDNSDYKELTETNSSSGGGSSWTSGCAAAKVKRIPRAVRNKTRETVEVRRNPMRVSKKDVDKDFPRPRQRLLTNRREVCASYEVGKRTRSSATPYMNTRSVTRKMYTVGATYQAPTKRDETEWKEWPVHGMHERPVYHPQAGLATEYLGKYFVSFDGLSYCEIVDDSEVEVVAVDPRYDRRPSSADKKPGKAKAKNKRATDPGDPPSTSGRSFGACMHGSLHCVLGYCSQMMTSSHRQVPEEKPTITRSAAKTKILEMATLSNTTVKDSSANVMEHLNKFAEGVKLLEDYTIAMTQSAPNKNATSNRCRAAGAATVASSSATYVPPEAHRSMHVELDNSKILPSTNRPNLPMLRGFPNASLVLLRNSSTKTSGEVCKMKDTKDPYSSAKMENAAVGEETLSSMYKKLMSANEAANNGEASPARNSFYTLKRQHSAISTRECNLKRSALDAQLENTRGLRLARNEHTDNAKIKQPDGGVFATGGNVKNRSWCTSETSEIARILSEYNRGATKKSAIQIYGGASKDAKASLATVGAKYSAKTRYLWQKDAAVEENLSVPGDKSTGLELPQGKWRKLSNLENTGNQTGENERSVSNRHGGPSPVLENSQGVPSRDRHVNPSYTREKSAVVHKDVGKQARQTLAIDVKPRETVTKYSKDEAGVFRGEDYLQELLENTAMLYCAANGIHQDDLSSYINTLDAKQSIQWLETLTNLIE